MPFLFYNMINPFIIDFENLLDLSTSDKGIYLSDPFILYVGPFTCPIMRSVLKGSACETKLLL